MVRLGKTNGALNVASTYAQQIADNVASKAASAALAEEVATLKQRSFPGAAVVEVSITDDASIVESSHDLPDHPDAAFVFDDDDDDAELELRRRARLRAMGINPDPDAYSSLLSSLTSDLPTTFTLASANAAKSSRLLSHRYGYLSPLLTHPSVHPFVVGLERDVALGRFSVFAERSVLSHFGITSVSNLLTVLLLLNRFVGLSVTPILLLVCLFYGVNPWVLVSSIVVFELVRRHRRRRGNSRSRTPFPSRTYWSGLTTAESKYAALLSPVFEDDVRPPPTRAAAAAPNPSPPNNNAPPPELAGASSKPEPEPMPMPPPFDVMVLGGGLSALYSAALLSRKGYKVLVLCEPGSASSPLVHRTVQSPFSETPVSVPFELFDARLPGASLPLLQSRLAASLGADRTLCGLRFSKVGLLSTPLTHAYDVVSTTDGVLSNYVVTGTGSHGVSLLAAALLNDGPPRMPELEGVDKEYESDLRGLRGKEDVKTSSSSSSSTDNSASSSDPKKIQTSPSIIQNYIASCHSMANSNLCLDPFFVSKLLHPDTLYYLSMMPSLPFFGDELASLQALLGNAFQEGGIRTFECLSPLLLAMSDPTAAASSSSPRKPTTSPVITSLAAALGFKAEASSPLKKVVTDGKPCVWTGPQYLSMAPHAYCVAESFGADGVNGGMYSTVGGAAALLHSLAAAVKGGGGELRLVGGEFESLLFEWSEIEKNAAKAEQKEKARDDPAVVSSPPPKCIGVRTSDGVRHVVSGGEGKTLPGEGVVLSTVGLLRSHLELVPAILRQKYGVPGGVVSALSERRPEFKLALAISGSGRDLDLPEADYWRLPSVARSEEFTSPSDDDDDDDDAGEVHDDGGGGGGGHTKFKQGSSWMHVSFQSERDPSWDKRYGKGVLSTCVVTIEADDDFVLKPVVVEDKPSYKIYSIKSVEERAKKKLEARVIADLVKLFPAIEGKIIFSELIGPVRKGLSHCPDRFDVPGVRPTTKYPGLVIGGEDLAIDSFSGKILGGLLAANAVVGYGFSDLCLFGKNIISDLEGTTGRAAGVADVQRKGDLNSSNNSNSEQYVAVPF